MKSSMLAAFALLSIAGAAQAGARPTPPPPSVTVRYADLDLRQAHDAAVMLKRIQRAAADACREASGAAGNDPESILRNSACYRETLTRAVAGLNAPKVSELFDAASGAERLARLP